MEIALTNQAYSMVSLSVMTVVKSTLVAATYIASILAGEPPQRLTQRRLLYFCRTRKVQMESHTGPQLDYCECRCVGTRNGSSRSVGVGNPHPHTHTFVIIKNAPIYIHDSLLENDDGSAA